LNHLLELTRCNVKGLRRSVPLSALALITGLHAQTPSAAPSSPASAAARSAEKATPPSAAALTKAQALKEIEIGLARLEVAIEAETSPVVKAAMKTRLNVLRQRQRDLVKNYTARRFRILRWR
jgi:hypothetical protein